MASPEVGARRRGERAHRIGFATNTGLAIAKVVVGTLAGSPALLADGWHSLTDVLTGAAAWFGFRISVYPPDEDHHYGHGKAEAAAGLFVGMVLVGGGLTILWQSVTERASVHPGSLGTAALGIALISILCNVWLVRLTGRAARELSSPGLMALHRDNLGDVYTGVLVFFGVGASLLGLPWIEPLVAIVIASLIVNMGLRSARESFDVLMDRVSDPMLRSEIRDAALSVGGVRGVQVVRVHPVGTAYRVDMEISVDGSITVSEGHEIAHEAERAITTRLHRVLQVQVHVNPSQDASASRSEP